MNTVSSQLPSLADTLLSLSSQTQPGNLPTSSGDADSSSEADSGSGTDFISLSAGSASSIDSTASEIESQNLSSILGDSAAALGATRMATAYLQSQPNAALAAQNASTSASVLSLLTGD